MPTSEIFTWNITSPGVASVISQNDNGPFYHNGYVYYVYLNVIPAQFWVVKSLDGEVWSFCSSMASNPNYNPSDTSVYSVCEYGNSSSAVHKFYLMANTNQTTVVDPFGLVQFNSLDFWEFDLITETFTLLSNQAAYFPNGCVSSILDSTIYQPPIGGPPAGPVDYVVMVTQNNFLIRCDPNTGYVYFFCLGEPTAYPCPTDPHGPTLYSDNLVYYIWNGFSWSSAKGPIGGTTVGKVEIIQAYIDNGSRIFIVVGACSGHYGDISSGCGTSGQGIASLNVGLTLSLYQLIPPTTMIFLTTLPTYIFNEPGCPPYNDPNLVIGAFIFTASGGISAPMPFPTASVFSPISKFVEWGGFIWFCWTSPNRKLNICKLMGSTGVVVIKELNQIVCIGNSNDSLIQPVIYKGQLVLMWYTENQLPPSQQDGGWFPTSWTHLPDSICSSSTTYSNIGSGFPNVNWETYNGISEGPLQIIDFNIHSVSFRELTHGLMPFIVPQSGFYYNAGDLTFATIGPIAGYFATPRGFVAEPFAGNGFHVHEA